MVAHSSPSSERTTILRVTAALGVSLGIFQGIIWVLSRPFSPGVTYSPSLLAFLYLVAPLIWIIAFFLHGVWVGKRTSDTRQGWQTGMFGGVFGGLTASVGHVLVITLSLQNLNQSPPLVIGWLALGVTVETLLFTIVGGIVFGLLGSLVGKYISPEDLNSSRPSPAPTPPPPTTSIEGAPLTFQQ